jgi:hypothetical protein
MEEQIQNNQAPIISNATLSQSSVENLRNTAKWMNFLSILGFIGCGLMVFAALIMLIAGGTLGGMYGGMYGAGMGIGMFLVYIIMAVIMIFPCIFLYNYARSLREFCNSNNSDSLEAAFVNQKKYWTFLGIYAIVYLCFIALAILIGIIVALAAI